MKPPAATCSQSMPLLLPSMGHDRHQRVLAFHALASSDTARHGVREKHCHTAHAPSCRPLSAAPRSEPAACKSLARVRAEQISSCWVVTTRNVISLAGKPQQPGILVASACSSSQDSNQEPAHCFIVVAVHDAGEEAGAEVVDHRLIPPSASTTTLETVSTAAPEATVARIDGCLTIVCVVPCARFQQQLKEPLTASLTATQQGGAPTLKHATIWNPHLDSLPLCGPGRHHRVLCGRDAGRDRFPAIQLELHGATGTGHVHWAGDTAHGPAKMRNDVGSGHAAACVHKQQGPSSLAGSLRFHMAPHKPAKDGSCPRAAKTAGGVTCA